MVDVKNNQVELERFHFLDSVLSIDSLAANFKIQLGLQGVSYSTAKHLVVVRDRYSLPQSIPYRSRNLISKI